MKKLLLALAATTAVLGFAAGASAADKAKICFVYVGSKTDGGWTQAHDLGRQELERRSATRSRPSSSKTYRKDRMPNAPSSVWPAPAAA